MKTQKTIYHLVVDKSGSMGDCIEQTVNGFNEQISRIKEMESEFPEQEISIGLTTFNHTVDHIYYMRQLSGAYKMTFENYIPNGSTAMLDAMAETMLRLSNRLEESNKQLPTTIVMVILTDGYENASTKYTLKNVKEMVEAREASGTWTFSFLGATLDAVDVAEKMSIPRENSVAFHKASMKDSVWDRLNDSMRGYYDRKRKGEDLRKMF
jgi:hypothetical protein